MLFPSLSEVRTLSQSYDVIPVFWEIPADHLSPLQIYAALSRHSEHAFLLEGISTPSAFRRWSYIGCDPQMRFSVKDGRSEFAVSKETCAIKGGMAQHVQEFLACSRSPVFPDLPEFTGGLAGFCMPKEPLLSVFGLYYEIIAYDHLKSTVVIILNLLTGCDIAAQYQAAEIRAAQLAAEMEAYYLEPQFKDDAPPIRTVCTDGCTEVENAPDSFELYRRMRSSHPSPHLCFFRNGVQRFAGVCGSTKTDGKAYCGYRGFGGNVYEFFAQPAVHYPDAGTSRAVIDCENPEEILALMRSAKLENPSA